MKKPLFIVLVALLIAGVVVAYISDIPIVDYTALAVAFASAGALCCTTIGKSEKKDWKVYTAVSCIGLSAFMLGFCGVTGDYISKIITGVIGVILLIAGIFAAIKVPKPSVESKS